MLRAPLAYQPEPQRKRSGTSEKQTWGTAARQSGCALLFALQNQSTAPHHWRFKMEREATTAAPPPLSRLLGMKIRCAKRINSYTTTSEPYSAGSQVNLEPFCHPIQRAPIDAKNFRRLCAVAARDFEHV